MKRWTSLNSFKEDARWGRLAELIRAAGVENEYVPYTEDVQALDSLDSFSGYHHLRISSRIGPKLLQGMKVQSSWTTLLGVTDGMVQSANGWWPLCGLYESFSQLLHREGQDMDARGNVLIAGAGSAARVAMTAFFKAGFRKFLLTNSDAGEAEALIKDLRRKYFGMSMEWVSMDRIVLLSGDTTVLVNCTPAVAENPLLVELSYLNFLKRPGFLFDLSRGGTPSVLVQEAYDAGVKVILGSELGARTDVLWVKWAFGVDLDLESYIAVFEKD
jgi:hypothetical protein